MDRLFAPKRSLQEYLKNREKKISEIHEHVAREVSSLGKKPSAPECAMLEYSAEYQAVLDAAQQHQSTRSQYLSSLDKLQQMLRNWRWDDPISQLYAEIFDPNAIAKCGKNDDEVLEDLKYRSENNIPPGYKDKAKLDGGIGDLLIWYSIIELSKEKQVGVVFVSNDEKPDWVVRNGEGALYPRFELVAEFYQSTGQQLAIVNFLRFLELNDMSPETIDSVRHSYAEGLGRFHRLRQRIVSILDRLNDIATDFAYVEIVDGSECIEDNRFRGLCVGLDSCIASYEELFGSSTNLTRLREFQSLLEQIGTLQAGIEYERVRMKRDTTEESKKVQVLCREFMDRFSDFSNTTAANSEW